MVKNRDSLAPNLDAEEALKALPNPNFWVPYSMAEGPFLCMSDTTWGGAHRQVEGPFGTYPIRIFNLKSVT